MSQSSILNDLQFWQATTGETLQRAAQDFIWTAGAGKQRRFPWIVLGIVALLYYVTLRLGWLLLMQTVRQGPFFNGSLIAIVGVTALSYFCWRLTVDMGQRWRERQLRDGYEIQFSQPVFRFGEPMELRVRHFLKPGQPMPEGGTISAEVYCEESTSCVATAQTTSQATRSQATIPWQRHLGEVAIASQAASKLVFSNPALEARFDCTIPSGLPIACSVDIPSGNGEDEMMRLEVKWWLRFEVALPGIAAYQKALPIAVRA